jgi:hypothetical protein
MNVVLVDNLLIDEVKAGGRVDTSWLQPHLGLISLLAVLRAAGHSGRLYDPKLALHAGRLTLDAGLYRKMAQEIVACTPDVVGFTSLGCNFICTLKVAQHVRTLAPGVPILLGGPHATILDRVILERYSAFDVIVRNEAENTLPVVLEAVSNGRLACIPGITFRSAEGVRANPGAPLIDCLDALPMPSYEDYPIEELKLESLNVEAGRGCPFMCTFCSTASFFGRSYRLKSAARLRLELDELHARYGIRKFSLQHDLFTVNREKVLEFCDAIVGKGYEWGCSARIDCVDPKLLKAMKEAGCTGIYFGIESGSPYLQRVAEKRLDLTLFYPTLDACDALGIEPTVSFIIGYPQERLVDQEATLDMVGSCFYRLPPPSNVQVHLMAPEPGTRLLEDFKDHLAFDGFVSDFIFPTIEADDSALVAMTPEVFMNSHYFVAELPRRRHLMAMTLYRTLYFLSPQVLSYLIDQFGGRLSHLVGEFDTWAQAHDITSVRDDDVVAFCRDRLGANQVATSLVRYMVALSSVPNPARTQSAGSTTRAKGHSNTTGGVDIYKLNPHARILRDIHDCALLFEQIAHLQGRRHAAELAVAEGAGATESPGHRRGAASPRLLSEQIGSDWSSLVHRHEPIFLPPDATLRGDFLLTPVSGTNEIRTIRLNGELMSILHLFRQPRRMSELRRAANSRVTPRVVRSLVKAEALTAHNCAMTEPPATRALPPALTS